MIKLKQNTVDRNLVMLNNVFDACSTKYIDSKKLKSLTKGIDARFGKTLRDKKMLKVITSGVANKYKWNTIAPSKDMAIAVARECYEYNKNRRPDNVTKTTKKVTKPVTNTKKVYVTKPKAKANTIKSRVSVLWGLFTKETY